MKKDTEKIEKILMFNPYVVLYQDQANMLAQYLTNNGCEVREQNDEKVELIIKKNIKG